MSDETPGMEPDAAQERGGPGTSVAALPPTDLPMTSRRAHAVREGGERGAEDEAVSERRPPRSPAEWAYRRLILYIARFEETLDAEHEVAMGFTDGGTGVIRIEGMGHFDPDIVTFYGADPRGMKVQLIQHVTQLSVLLRAVPKRRPEEAPRRIGFRLRADLEEADEAEEGPEPGDDGAPEGLGADPRSDRVPGT